MVVRWLGIGMGGAGFGVWLGASEIETTSVAQERSWRNSAHPAKTLDRLSKRMAIL